MAQARSTPPSRTAELWQWLREHPWVAIFLFIAGLALAAFSELASELREGELGPFDRTVAALVTYYHSPALFWAAYVLSLPLVWPYVGMFDVLIVLILWRLRCNLMAWAYAIIPLLTGGIIEALKELFRRNRPMHGLIYVVGHSFPSGHAAGSVVAYGLLAYIAWRCWVFSTWGRTLLVVAAAILIIATGLSRIYLGVHYPSDVAGGWIAGLFILFGSIIILEWLRMRRGRNV